MKTRLLLFIIPLFLLCVSCNEKGKTDLSQNSIIPKPQIVSSTGGQFKVSKRLKINYNTDTMILSSVTDYLSSVVNDYTGIKAVSKLKKSISGRGVFLTISGNENLGKEGYQLEITKKRIIIEANQVEGIFRGIQTIHQLMMLENSDVQLSDRKLILPTGVITDMPEYEYRGTMLDVARHFFKADTIKKYIDVLALYKINVLHLHLADDQGWRIEIKSWPKLTEIGGSTEVGGGEGGYFTQEEYRDLVDYASKRFITIIPEIDMPGHTNAALASYAELNCNGEATQLYTGTRVGFSTLCTRNELTYTFIDDVVREIGDMTPGPYFHMGGDESHVTELPDYIYFVDRVKKIIHSHGKTMIGWDEISHAALSEGDIAQYWASSENAVRAREKGAKLIFSPAKQCYLDMQYDSSTVLGLHWAAYIEVDDAYNWNPASLVDGMEKENILGIESPLWSETIESLDDIEYMAFPRLIGHAEIGWSNSDSLSWDDYRDRLKVHERLLDKLGLNYYKSGLVD